MKTPILEAFLNAVRSKIPNIDECMNGGCSEDEIAELEQTVGKQLPKSYTDLLRKFNGEKKLVLFMGGFVLLNVKKVLWEHNFVTTNPYLKETDVVQAELIQPYHYQRNRISFAGASGCFLCIDYSPGEKGKEGQIIYLPLSQPEPLSVVFNDFDEYLSFLTQAINEGKVKVSEDENDDSVHYYFEKTWRDDWTDIAANYIQK